MVLHSYYTKMVMNGLQKDFFYQALPFYFGILGTWGVRRGELVLLPKRTDHLAFFA